MKQQRVWGISTAGVLVVAVLLCLIFGSCRDSVDAQPADTTAQTIEETKEVSQTWTTTQTTETSLPTTAETTEATDPPIDDSAEEGTTRRTVSTTRPFDGKLIQVPYISQEGILPNGCEAVSATMLLQYWGYFLTAEDFVDRYLDCVRMNFSQTPWRGPDPNEAYAGDPRSLPNGIGCFAPVIVRAIERVIEEEHQVKNLTGISLEQLCRDYIDQGIPAAVWATVNMRPITRYHRWVSFDGSESYEYPSGEHCLVLVGYDDTRYYFNDPYDSRGLMAYSRSAVNARYEDLERQAVVITEAAKSTVPSALTSAAENTATGITSQSHTSSVPKAQTTVRIPSTDEDALSSGTKTMQTRMTGGQ